ncbi:MAG: Flp family type IVb pilin [Actinomycetota bacterium]|nr:Flp family type IVb pilin [Actinomycetota bacterium]
MLTKMYVRFQTALASDEGATALEYGVLAVFIALAIVAGVTVFGTALSSFFSGLIGRFPL